MRERPVALLLALLLQLCHSERSLGPGRGKWVHEPPERQGLDSQALADAGALLGSAVPHRYCFTVVKGGSIVHDQYFGKNTSSSKYRTQSLGKSMVATMIGTLVQKGLLDLDVPLQHYGVKPGEGGGGKEGSWNLTGIDFYPNVTARHLLSQASGYGKVPPGTMFTYDSYYFIQHLSALIRAVTGMSPTRYAREAYGEPMGMPDLFDYDGYIYDIGDDISPVVIFQQYRCALSPQQT